MTTVDQENHSPLTSEDATEMAGTEGDIEVQYKDGGDDNDTDCETVDGVISLSRSDDSTSRRWIFVCLALLLLLGVIGVSLGIALPAKRDQDKDGLDQQQSEVEETPMTAIPYTYMLADEADERGDYFFADPDGTALTDGLTEDTSRGKILAWQSTANSTASTHHIILDLEHSADVSLINVYGVNKPEVGLSAPASFRGQISAGRNRVLGRFVETINATAEGPWVHSFDLAAHTNVEAATRVTLDFRCPAIDFRAESMAIRRCGISDLVLLGRSTPL